jgi:hypothetical protein
MATKISSRASKADVLKAYEELQSELNQMKKQLKSASSAPSSSSSASSTPISSASGDEASSIDAVISSLEAIGEGFGGAANFLAASLRAEAIQLEALRSQIDTNLSDIKTLHDVSVADDPSETLRDLINQYETLSETFEKESTKKSEAFDEEMAEKNKAWEREQQDHAQAIKERDAELRKTRQRENAEYEYEVKQERKLITEKLAEEKKIREKEKADFLEAKDREWTAREEEVSKREKEYAETKAKAEKLPELLETGTKKAKEEGAGIARQQAKVKADLLAKTIEGEQKVNDLAIKSREEAINAQLKQITALEQQLSNALKQAQDLAVKAIEGPSHTGSFEALKEIALKQAGGIAASKK